MRLEHRGGDCCHPLLRVQCRTVSAWLGSLGMWGAPSIPSMWDVGQSTVDWLWPRYVGAVRLIDAANAAAMPEYEAIPGAPEPFLSSCGGGHSDGRGVVLRAIYTTDPKWALHGFSARLDRTGIASSIVLSSDLTGTVPPLRSLRVFPSRAPKADVCCELAPGVWLAGYRCPRGADESSAEAAADGSRGIADID